MKWWSWDVNPEFGSRACTLNHVRLRKVDLLSGKGPFP